jgi:hypothetical protein
MRLCYRLEDAWSVTALGTALAITNNPSEAERRLRVVLNASTQIGSTDRERYAEEAVGNLRDADLRYWCGYFVLAMILSGSSAAAGTLWTPGRGFLYKRSARTTRAPNVGDVAYKQEPYQHYGLIYDVRENGTVHRIDGNTSGGKVDWASNAVGDPNWTYYDASPFYL